MIKLTTTLTSIKKKLAIGVLGASLVAAPGGVALAHGSYHEKDDNRNFHQQTAYGHDRHESDWQKTCDQRQADADQAIADFKVRAQQRFNGLSAYLADMQAFVASNSQNIDNFDELNTKATDAQTKAQGALDNISSPTINCHHSPRHDRKQIHRAEHELLKSIMKFNGSVKSISDAIADDTLI